MQKFTFRLQHITDIREWEEPGQVWTSCMSHDSRNYPYYYKQLVFQKQNMPFTEDTYIPVYSLMYRNPGNKPKVNNEIVYFVTKTTKYF